MIRMRQFALCLFVGLACPSVATNLGDSLRFLLDADASAQERIKAMIHIATRAAGRDPMGALGYATNASRLAVQNGDSVLLREALVASGAIQQRLGLRAEFTQNSMRALRISLNLARPEWIAADLQTVSRARRLNDDPLGAVEEARKAVAVAAPTRDLQLILNAEAYLLETLIDAGLLVEARRCADRALALSADANDPDRSAAVRLLMGKAMLAQGKHLDAQPYLVSAERTLCAGVNPEACAQARLALARMAIQAGRIPAATEHLAAAEAAIRGHSSPAAMRRQVLELYRDLALARNDHRSAYGQLTALKAMDDSLRNADRELILTGMRVMHDVDQMDLDNAELRERNNRNEGRIANQRAHNRILIGSTVALLVFVGALLMFVLRTRRIIRWSRMKSAVIERQKNELHVKSLELEQQNLRLRDTLLSEEQKDLVLREIHHRVKNNLQVIDSLLGLHIGDPADPAASRALREAQGRIRAMAMVHTAIYRRGGEHDLPVGDHLHELARLVLVAHGRHDAISVVVDAPPDRLHAKELMPLSLIVNELLSNSLKYAFANRDQGHVRIALQRVDGSWVMLFSDNGDCPTDERAYVRPGSFGQDLLRALADQLGGQLSIRSVNGTQVRLEFEAVADAFRKAS
ncbi:MAG: hypothetical protein IPM46_06190 [Flavobacteriales bacterium]|nr:hypothetical protein [Flavobacteriales bacterium]